MAANDCISVEIMGVYDETDEIRRFQLQASDGSELPAYDSGSHVDVHIRDGLIRQYSLCGDQGNLSEYQIAVKREPKSRGGSEAMHTVLKLGDLVNISTPRNNFPLDEEASHSILLAGGIGVTPIISMADRLHKLNKSFEMHYFTRSPSQTAFHDRLVNSAYETPVHFHYSLDPDGVRTYLRKHLWHREEGAQLYLCGPKPFMDMIESVAMATWPPEAVHLEYFSADSAALSGPKAEFTVALARSGGSYPVSADQTIVEALSEAGVEVDYSCEQGVCGTCLTGVLEGQPDHRDMFLTPAEQAENDRICLCVSRSHSDILVLDL